MSMIARMRSLARHAERAKCGRDRRQRGIDHARRPAIIRLRRINDSIFAPTGAVLDNVADLIVRVVGLHDLGHGRTEHDIA
jgi:hypothetical protein